MSEEIAAADSLLRANAEVARLQAALEWYADVSNYDTFGALIDRAKGQFCEDRGAKARAALKEKETT